MSEYRARVIRAMVLAAGLALALGGGLSPVISVPLAVLLVLLYAYIPEPRTARARGADTPPEREPADEFQHLIAPLAEGVLLLDAERHVVAANAAAARIVGRPPDSLTGVSLIVAIRDHDLAEVARQASGVPQQVHVSSVAHEVVATATAVDAGDVRTLLVLEDITELERARRARAELVANMSHELRTPIASARALAETLQDGVEEADARAHFTDQLAEAISRLGQMVERLLWLSRLESGSEPFADQPLQPSWLARTARERIEPIARQHGVRVEVDAPDSLPPVRGDTERVLEVLTNLLDNALKHSPSGGGVRLRAELAAEASAVRFEVQDDGPGILPTDRERIFERFYTADRARGAGGGTGLGLAIARHIVQRHGGRIWVADRTPGATFCFTLPVAAADSGVRDEEQA